MAWKDFLGRDNDSKATKDSTADKSQGKTPDIPEADVIKLPATSEPKETPTSVLEMLEFIALASPETRSKVKELAKGLREKSNKFFRVFVKYDDPEGEYYVDEDEALDKWGHGKYKSVFRLVMPLDENGNPQPLGRLATEEEEKPLIKAEAERKRKKREAKADKNNK